jgi:uncharacterized circularly permuted ATP-grasp superfamily protein
MSTEQKYFDEMLGFDATASCPYANYDSWFQAENMKRLRRKSTKAKASFQKTGIIFNVYGESEAAEHLIPFDIVPCIISGRE